MASANEMCHSACAHIEMTVSFGRSKRVGSSVWTEDHMGEKLYGGWGLSQAGLNSWVTDGPSAHAVPGLCQGCHTDGHCILKGTRAYVCSHSSTPFV